MRFGWGKKGDAAVTRYRLAPPEIQPIADGHGACTATDRITVHGDPVGYMYREAPGNDVDSGWRFVSGTASEAYVDDQPTRACTT